MPDFLETFDTSGAVATITWADLSLMARGYVEALFFTDTGPDQAEEGLGPECAFDDLSSDALMSIVERCEAFAAHFSKGYGDATDEQVGRDIHFTANHHGCGFWDRPELYGKALAEELTEAAHRLGEVDLCRGDDGKLYLS